MKKREIFIVLLVVLLAASGPLLCSVPQNTQGPQEEASDRIIPAPKNIQEATSIYVFLGWIWLSILVLIFFLRLKIKEADRLHELGFFTDHKD